LLLFSAIGPAQDTTPLPEQSATDTDFGMSVYKVFQPAEKVNVQFRAEGFNIFNHTQWRGVNKYAGTANFMFPAYAHMPQVLQFAIRITF